MLNKFQKLLFHFEEPLVDENVLSQFNAKTKLSFGLIIRNIFLICNILQKIILICGGNRYRK